MKLRRIIIKNFRSISNVDIPIDDYTVLIGENNSGKTAFLNAIRLALPWNRRRSSPFKEYDFHMIKDTDSPQTCDGIEIELWFKEDTIDEWPETLIRDLDEVIQSEITTGLNFIGIRLHCVYDESTEYFNWEFLNADSIPLSGVDNRNYQKFFSYIRVFYLSPLRDSKNEFSTKSAYWGRIIKNLNIDDDYKDELIKNLSDINEALLSGDKRFEEVIDVLDSSKEIMDLSTGQKTSIRALPLKPWELMSRSEVVIKSGGNEVEFPLDQHGQGTQSLTVIFLFKAFIEVFLKPTFKDETEAIITLEEPEAHLHPQAIRSLASNLEDIPSQKIISSHSPYFIQEIPFKQIRMFRKNGGISKVLYIKTCFDAQIPKKPALINFCKLDNEFSYDEKTSVLHLKGKMNHDEHRKLIKMFMKDKDVLDKISTLNKESQLHINDEELIKLERFAKRTRGEILFAHSWILCEGPTDYSIIKYFAELLNLSLDPLGISVIDYQNNGSPKSFVSLAKVFEIPWVLFCDNDEAGDSVITKLNSLPLTQEEQDDAIRQLPGTGVDIEKFLIENGFLEEYIEILTEDDITITKNRGNIGFEEEIHDLISEHKTRYATALIEKLKDSGADRTSVPEFFKSLIEYITGKG